MSASQTIARVIQRQEDNSLLQTAIPMPMPRHATDASVDQPTSAVDIRMVDKAATALREGQTHYVDVPGIAPLREKLTAFVAELGGRDYATSHMLVTAGVQEARFLTLQILGASVTSIGVPSVIHPGVRLALGVRPLPQTELPVDENTALPTLAGLRAALEGGCKLIYLESPARLTGAAYSAHEVQTIGALLEKFDATAIWDQGLAPWTQSDYVSLGSQPGMAERVLLLGEVWPGVGLESWFVGYIAAPTARFEALRAQKQIIAICTSTASQYAAVAAAEVYADQHPAQAATYAEAHNQALASAQAAGLTILPGDTVTVVALRLTDAQRARLTEAGIDVADGAAFGAPGTVRLTTTDAATVQQALTALGA